MYLFYENDRIEMGYFANLRHYNHTQCVCVPIFFGVVQNQNPEHLYDAIYVIDVSKRYLHIRIWICKVGETIIHIHIHAGSAV